MIKIYKKIKRRRKILFGIFFFLLLSCFFLMEKRRLLWIEKIGKDSILFVRNLGGTTVKTTEEYFNLKSMIVQNEELEKEIKELKEMLELKHMLSDKVLVSANVVHRNLGFFYDTVTINKGMSSGIEEGMAVVTKDGLIGKTINVSNYFSDVQLLTGENMGKVSVKIKSGDSYAYGLLTGYDSKKNIYLIEGISETLNINLQEEVTTTGFGDVFPSGILIGTVTNITTDHFDLTKIIEVTPSSNIQDFSVVSILKRNVDS